ncbi:VOC family protein [Chromobacterium sp. IIBBL 290-4]|uniref:VOC family protein n=1 Tax=Chromobacterium sp. IIBBL 290-4 TaxID=2953890 RepID=UPI0020B65472|nr:VOC family protein [Chromobacterium sp. IIBBL 290-4]UTH73689.1 hypothetical protein NKT35_19420 [Chromobacterium sp. IIBBL 290-4]
MRIRSVYLKVLDMEAERAFWQAFLLSEPSKSGSHWSEFALDGARLGLLLNDFGEKIAGSGAVPVFEFEAGDLPSAIARAQSAGALVVLDGLDNPQMNSIVLSTPGGHEFELCNCRLHD